MKKNVFIAVALFATLTTSAQNIAVVSPSNSTKIYMTLDEAIAEAESGSIIYMPGGGFQVTDNAKIDKPLTIMGVSHRGDTDNVDGATIISGNLSFIEGSSKSAVIGVYVSGNINIGTSEDSVTNFTMRYCNVNSIQVKNSHSSAMKINQCYMRNNSDFGYCNVKLENNIMHSVKQIEGGVIDHNIITENTSVYVGDWDYNYKNYAMAFVVSSNITNNFILNGSYIHRGDNCYASNNCVGTGSWGDNPAVLPENTTWENVFKANKGVTIASDYRLTDTWAGSTDPDLTSIGIYGGGTNFKDQNAVAPIPRIVSKRVDEQTDGSGKLSIEVTVKAQ